MTSPEDKYGLPPIRFDGTGEKDQHVFDLSLTIHDYSEGAKEYIDRAFPVLVERLRNHIDQQFNYVKETK